MTKFSIKQTLKNKSDNKTASKTSKAAVGLINLGNTCYANSVLQSLLNSYHLKPFLLGNWNEAKHKNSPILNAFLDLSKQYWSGRYQSIEPEKMVRKIQEANPNFVPYSQQDSHEFFVTLIDLIHEEIHTIREKKIDKIQMNEKQILVLKSVRDRFNSLQHQETLEFHVLANLLKKGNPKMDLKKNFSILGDKINQKICELEKSIDSENKDTSGNNKIPTGRNENEDNGKNESPLIDKEEIENFENKGDKVDKEKDLAIQKVLDIFTSDKIVRNHFSKEGKNSLIKDLLFGVLEGKVTCKECNNVSSNDNLFSSIPLSLPYDKNEDDEGFISYAKSFFVSNKKVFTLQDCLRNFCGTEGLKGSEMYYCSHCKKKTQASKKLLFKNTPPILCLQIKRFYHSKFKGVQKIDDSVSFPVELLDLSPFKIDENTSVKYSLTALIEHTGKQNSGHYISCVREGNFADKWMEINDRFVKSISVENLKRRQPYLLFYERVNDAKMVQENIEFVESVMNDKTTKNNKNKAKTLLLSKQWIRKVSILEHPGALENRELVCKHDKREIIGNGEEWNKFAVPLTLFQWDRLKKRFGNQNSFPVSLPKPEANEQNGGLSNKNSENGDEVEKQSCKFCEREKLDVRRKRERNKVTSLEQSFKLKKETVTYIISENWLSAWRCFVNNETDLLPGQIINEHLLNENKKINIDMRIEKDFRVVSKEVWEYLQSIYGGGPEIVNDFINERDLI